MFANILLNVVWTASKSIFSPRSSSKPAVCFGDGVAAIGEHENTQAPAPRPAEKPNTTTTTCQTCHEVTISKLKTRGTAPRTPTENRSGRDVGLYFKPLKPLKTRAPLLLSLSPQQTELGRSTPAGPNQPPIWCLTRAYMYSV